LAKTVSSSSEAPDVLMRRLEAEGCRHAYIDGGITIQRFLAAGLIDELTVTLIPVLLGEGRPLFGTLKKDVKLKLLRTKAYEFGFVQVTYSTR
jgi:dihydrofolate reductase